MNKLLLKLAPHFLYLVVIIALLILLQRGCGQVDAANARADKAVKEREAAEQDYQWELRLNAGYQNGMQEQIRKAQQAAKKADSSERIQKLLEREIKQLYAELGKPWPRDTISDVKCCELARDLVDANEAHRADDSAKDAAMLMQIDLATAQVDSLNILSDRWRGRYQLIDSLNRLNQRDAKPRGSMWFGVEANIGPVSSGGLYLRYAAPGGKEYGVVAGFQPMGWYLGGKLGTKISFRKKRRL